ncbi:Chloride channel protein CLC-e-like protein [Drosera capensis]
MVATCERIQTTGGIPRSVFPVFDGVFVGLLALAYPEILDWGFENVDILLESRPFVAGLSANLLLQLVAIKILATSLGRASGLVGGDYAPSLFIGAATGMAYEKFLAMSAAQSHPFVDLSFIEMASPQAYGLVGMATTLAGVCQVTLTSVLLLFELTQDYRIVLPLLGAVGLSSWITSSQTRRMGTTDYKQLEEISNDGKQVEASTLFPGPVLSSTLPMKRSTATNLCEVESSLCLDDSDYKFEELRWRISVSEAMRLRYVTVHDRTLLIDVVTLMLAEVVDENLLIGFLLLTDIQKFSNGPKAKGGRHCVWLFHLCLVFYKINVAEIMRIIAPAGL